MEDFIYVKEGHLYKNAIFMFSKDILHQIYLFSVVKFLHYYWLTAPTLTNVLQIFTDKPCFLKMIYSPLPSIKAKKRLPSLAFKLSFPFIATFKKISFT